MRLSKPICEHMLILYPRLVQERKDLERYLEAVNRPEQGDGIGGKGGGQAEQERIIIAKEQSERLRKLTACVELIGGALESLPEVAKDMVRLRYWDTMQTLPVSVYDLGPQLGLVPETARRRCNELLDDLEEPLVRAWVTYAFGE